MTLKSTIYISIILLFFITACLPSQIIDAAGDSQAGSQNIKTGQTPDAAALSIENVVTSTIAPDASATPTITSTPHPLDIEFMRKAQYPGSELIIEETLAPGYNYDQFIASYLSEGLKIYALLTIPRGTEPETGFPAIIFNHGYIPPQEYRTTERYVAYVDRLARQGYIIFRPDYRGHGNSEGIASGPYWSPDYTIDVLNAAAALRQYPGVDPERIGMWGHSMGGHITLRSMVIDETIKTGVIWAGVAVSYQDMLELWHHRAPASSSATASPARQGWKERIYELYGSPEDDPVFWTSISPNSYLSDLSGPIQLHHGTNDETVPVIFSEILYSELIDNGINAELYLYPGDNHNIAQNFNLAMERTIEFFNKYLK